MKLNSNLKSAFLIKTGDEHESSVRFIELFQDKAFTLVFTNGKKLLLF